MRFHLLKTGIFLFACVALTAFAQTAPSVAITSPVAYAEFAPQTIVTLTASATASVGRTITKVEYFYAGTIKIGEATASPYSVTWTPAGSGIYALTAKATDNTTASTTTPNTYISVEVEQPDIAAVLLALKASDTPPTVALTTPPAGANLVTGSAVTIQATANDSDGFVRSVEFFQNGVSICQLQTAPYSCTWTASGSGNVTLTAVARDNLGVRTTSPAVVVAVGPNQAPVIQLFSSFPTLTQPNTPVSITASASDVNFGDVVSMQLFVNGLLISSGPTINTSYTPTRDGVYTGLVVATDSYGAKQQASLSFVAAVVPNAAIAIPTGTSPVGMVPGTFGVSDSGAASYSIPIAVPPGAAGVQPAIALSYNSQGADGHIGVGWSLNGLSMITRCPKTPAQDNVRAPVNYDADASNDVYCLDGERLIPIGNPDGITTEYRTERETFSRIYGYNDTHGLYAGIAGFRVWTKSGQILDYGSVWVVVSQGWNQCGRVNEVKVWPLDRVNDRVGNYYSVRYEGTSVAPAYPFPQSNMPCPPPTPPATGPFPPTEFYPTEIVYTRNDNTGAQPSVFSSVRLSYESRSPNATYQLYDSGAGQTLVTQRLRSIFTYDATQANPITASQGGQGEVTAWGNPVNSYWLSYEQSPATGRERLTSVKECVGASELNTCLTPTYFSWSNATSGLNGTNSGSKSATADGSDSTVAADFDGDGRSDLLRFIPTQPQRVERCLSTGNGFNCSTLYPNVSSVVEKGFFVDVSGDGKVDLVAFETPRVGNLLWVCPSNGVGFDPCRSQAGIARASGSIELKGDVDGDGRIDLLIYRGNGFWDVCLARDSSFDCRTNIAGPRGADGPNAQYHILIADFNGDGRADLAQRHSDSDDDNQWQICLSTFQPNSSPGGFTCPGAWTEAAKGKINQITLFDFNGDGLADMASREGSDPSTAWKVCLSAGDGTFDYRSGLSDARCNYWTGTPADVADNVIGDFNGDGRTDIAWYDSGRGTWKVCLSSGQGFQCTSDTAGWSSVVTPQGNAQSVVGGDFNGDGRTDISVHVGTGSSWNVGYANGPVGDLVYSVQTGLGATTTITYTPLTDAAVYSKSFTAAGANEVVIQSPLYVVSRTDASTGIANGAAFVTTYHYDGLKGNTAGRGLLGFARKSVTEVGSGALITNLTTTTSYRQDWPYAGRPSLIEKSNASGVLNRVTNTWSERTGSYPAVREVYLAGAVQETFELNPNGQPLALPSVTTTTSSQSDGYGSPLTVTVQTSDGFTKTTTNVYGANDPARWMLGRLTSATLVSTRPDSAEQQTRTTSYAYYPGSQTVPPAAPGALLSETIEPNDTLHTQSTSYQYDVWGNRVRADLTFYESGTPKTRTTRTTYDTRGRFPAQLIDAKNFTETRIYDNSFGGLTIANHPNQTRTEYTYDGFGRKTSESLFDALYSGGHVVARTTLTWGPGGTGEAYSILTSTAQGSRTTVYFDSLNREVRRVTNAFDGSLATATTLYDGLGRKQSVTRPYASTGGTSPSRTTTWLYDALNRVQKETSPDAIEISYDYTVVSTSDPDYPTVAPRAQLKLTKHKGSPVNDQVTIRQTNSQGQVLRAVDPEGGVTRFAYDPFGNLAKVVNPTSTVAGTPVTQMTYDIRGRRIEMIDADMGRWTYGYNGIGELISQTDGRRSPDWTTTQQFDALGRPVLRSEVSPTLGTRTTTWAYDNDCPGGSLYAIGQTCSTSVSGGAQTSHEYDAQARPFKTTVTIDGKPNTTYTLYDSLGRVHYVGYPESQQGYAYGVYRDYNANGYFNTVSDLHGRTLWTALNRYLDGQLYQSSVGTAGPTTTRGYDTVGRPASFSSTVQNLTYTYTDLGNVGTRGDTLSPSWSETFSYDRLNRVLGVTGPNNKTFTYDSLGNFIVKSEGDLPGSFTYFANSHRVQSAGGRTYTYDANGNVQTDGGLRSITPNQFNLPLTIAGNGVTLTYEYDAARQRTKEIASTGSGTLTTVYVGSQFFEAAIQSSGGTTWRHFVMGPDGPIGVAIESSTQTFGTAPPVTAWYTDALGSVVEETDLSGGNAYRLSFDAWGKRRRGAATDLAGPFTLPSSITSYSSTRGFTSQEHLDEVGLVHMNGRVYDPLLGRFVSADPFVQATFDAQAWNRYAYVGNNPLGNIDPTGFSWWTTWRRPIFAIAAMVVLGPGGLLGEAGIAGAAWGATGEAAVFQSSVVAGFAAGGIQGGNLQSAVQGAVTASLFYGAGSIAQSVGTNLGSEGAAYATRVTLHAVVGCASSTMAGGSCGSGAAAAGFAALAGPPIQQATRGNVAASFFGTVAVGGFASRLGGGSFENGAVTAAYGYLFSQSGRSDTQPSREVEVPGDVKAAVAKTFEARFGVTPDVDQIRVTENSRWGNFLDRVTNAFTLGNYGVTATTYVNNIYLSSRITAEQFFAAPSLLLHEYFHVIQQWNTGDMSVLSYLLMSSKWEGAAKNFGNVNAPLYRSFFDAQPGH